MATITVDELLTSLGYDFDPSGLDQYTKGTAKAEKKTKEFGVSMADARSGLNKIGKFAAAAGLAVGAAMVAIAVDVASAGDEIAKTARITATAPKELQRLAFAAELSGVEFKKLKLSIITQNKLMAESRDKVTPFSEALSALGLEMADIDGLTTESRIGVFADALNGVADEATRAALAGKLLGEKAGPEMASFLAAGSAGLRAMGDEAEELGLIMGDKLLKNSEEFNDAGSRMKAVLKGLEQTLASELLPVGIELIEFLQEFIQNNDELIKRDVADLIKGFAAAVRVLLPFLLDMGGHIRTVITGAKELDERFGILDKGMTAIKIAAGLVAAPFIALGAIIVGVGKGIAALIDLIPGLSKIVSDFRANLGLGESDSEAFEPKLVGTTEEIRAKGGKEIAAAGQAKLRGRGNEQVRLGQGVSQLAALDTGTSSADLRAAMTGNSANFVKAKAAQLLPLALTREQTARQVGQQTLALGRRAANIARAGAVGGIGFGGDKRTPPKGGGGGGKRGKGGPGDFLSDLLGETGGGGGRISAGGGTAPLAGAGFQTINAQFQGRTEVNVTVPGGARVSADDVGDAVVEALERRDREIFDHYQKIVSVG